MTKKVLETETNHWVTLLVEKNTNMMQEEDYNNNYKIRYIDLMGQPISEQVFKLLRNAFNIADFSQYYSDNTPRITEGESILSSLKNNASQGIQKAKLIHNNSLVDTGVWDGNTNNYGPMMLYLISWYLTGEFVEDLFNKFKNGNIESSKEIDNLIRGEFDKEVSNLEGLTGNIDYLLNQRNLDKKEGLKIALEKVFSLPISLAKLEQHEEKKKYFFHLMIILSQQTKNIQVHWIK